MCVLTRVVKSYMFTHHQCFARLGHTRAYFASQPPVPGPAKSVRSRLYDLVLRADLRPSDSTTHSCVVAVYHIIHTRVVVAVFD